MSIQDVMENCGLSLDMFQWDFLPDGKPSNEFIGKKVRPAHFHRMKKALGIDENISRFSAEWESMANNSVYLYQEDLWAMQETLLSYDSRQGEWRGQSNRGTYMFPSKLCEYALAREPIEYYKRRKYQPCTNGYLWIESDEIRMESINDLVEDGVIDVSNSTITQFNSEFWGIDDDGNTIKRISTSVLKQIAKDIDVVDNFIDEDGQQHLVLTLDSIGRYDELIALPIEFFKFKPKSMNTIEERINTYGCRILTANKMLEFISKTFGTDSFIVKDFCKNYSLTNPNTKTQDTPAKKETTPMMTPNFDAKELLNQNKDALLLAAKLEVGEAAVRQISKVIKKQLPLMVKGYADLPIFDILVANVVVMAIKQFAPDNEKAQIIADAMLIAAVQKQMQSFNIPEMIDEFIEGVDVTKITKLNEDK